MKKIIYAGIMVMLALMSSFLLAGCSTLDNEDGGYNGGTNGDSGSGSYNGSGSNGNGSQNGNGSYGSYLYSGSNGSGSNKNGSCEDGYEKLNFVVSDCGNFALSLLVESATIVQGESSFIMGKLKNIGDGVYIYGIDWMLEISNWKSACGEGGNIVDNPEFFDKCAVIRKTFSLRTHWECEDCLPFFGYQVPGEKMVDVFVTFFLKGETGFTRISLTQQIKIIILEK